MHGHPVRIRGRVKSLHDGRFVEPEVRHGGGRYWDMGLTSVIEVEGSTRDLPNILMLTSKRVIPFSLHQMRSCGVYPERQKILVAKGVIAPRAAYEPISAQVIAVDSPGVTSSQPEALHFQTRPSRSCSALACISHHMTAEARDMTAMTSLFLRNACLPCSTVRITYTCAPSGSHLVLPTLSRTSPRPGVRNAGYVRSTFQIRPAVDRPVMPGRNRLRDCRP